MPVGLSATYRLPRAPGDRRRGKERDEAAMHLAVIFKRFYCG